MYLSDHPKTQTVSSNGAVLEHFSTGVESRPISNVRRRRTSAAVKMTMSCGKADPGGDGRNSESDIAIELESLRNRVKELEAENAKLLSQISCCQCQQMGVKHELSVLESGSLVRRSKRGRRKAEKSIPSHLISKRYIALKIMYFGKRFYGFSAEAQMEPSIESEIFKAFERTRLLVGDKKDCNYSRCGRTDKGVSSTGQVVALFLRSRLKTPPGEALVDEKMGLEGEYDYVRVLNRALPDDIRVIGWSPVPIDFHARFSCSAREYKYFFWRQNLDLSAMDTAGKKFLGEHDFRNFCKMDVANVHVYTRRVTFFEVSPCQNSHEGAQLCTFTMRGSAFLWHQVRAMVAVLFMIGQGVESVDLIDTLLDTKTTPRKPQYLLASEIPLVLRTCEFENINFICSSGAAQSLQTHFKNESLRYQLESVIFQEALKNCLPLTNEKSTCKSVEKKKKPAIHAPLLSRPTEPSYEERSSKLKSRQEETCSVLE
ncbi:unnamed protein product [Microthlaspi erraticum]|uniref:Pseudouridine synthase I TruA alpha/beta domain-containing protein n=1 Tax=Microthlaspi erraticum TaxID=1685480 RepID=A0A6D2HTA9_9BRAS|nr:unnamed protein product [Microthlaspi erraticum]